MKMKILSIISLALVALVGLTSVTMPVETKTETVAKAYPIKKYKKGLNFFIVSDWGWNGQSYQQQVADQMGIQADSTGARFIVSCGDNFQISGVASTQDPLWMKNFENVYTNNSLQVEWFPVFGNHDYKGNTQAQLDYSKISRRWRFEEHYYSFVKKINDSISARFIFLDTPPLVSEYYKPEYPDAAKQDSAKQIKWLNETLANSKEQWKIVFGHHPIYSASKKHGNTKEMIQKVKPLLEKYNAQFYFCGHDHDFQHLQEKGKNVEYMVTGTGGEVRPSSKNELSLFSASVPGYSIVSFHADSIRVIFMGANGQPQYTYERKK
jgi:tartrate-resistant acid phosphatase type 5